jgi:hypothetical protein
MLTTRQGLCAFLLTAACCLSPQGVRADDQNRPYDLRVVVHFGRHRLLSDDFRSQVQRELGDDLRASLGDLARVRVVTEHPRLGESLTGGLAVLDNWPADSPGGSGVKTHFVLIDYRDGQYLIRARQHDGATGLASPGPAGLYGYRKLHPVIRQEETPDRAFVGALAAGLVEQDLGLLGTVQGEPNKEGLVPVRLDSGPSDGPLARLVRPGQVFAIVARGSSSRPSTLPWALLRVEQEPVKSVCQCRYFSRHGDPLRKGDRCLLLGTIAGPLQIHLMVRDSQKREDPASLTLEFRHKSFEDKEMITLPSRSLNERQLHTPADALPFAHVGFVTVILPGNPLIRPIIPVALLDDEPVDIELTAEPERDPLRFSRENWEQDARATSLKLTPIGEKLNQLNREAKEQKDIQLFVQCKQFAQSKRKELGDDQSRLAAQRKYLWEAGRKLPETMRPDLGTGDQYIKLISDSEKKLEDLIANVEQLEKEEPRKQELLKQVLTARNLENQYEIREALNIYRKVIKEGFDDKDLVAHVKELEDIWKEKNEDHRKARDFIYDTWPKQKTARQLLDNVQKANNALDVCIAVKDIYGPQRLLLATLDHADRLSKEYAKLNPRLNALDEETAKEIKEVTEKLDALAQKANDYRRSMAPPNP